MTQLPTLILHIGHFKTGTTALQVHWQRNAAALAAQGVHYARCDRVDAKHSDIAFATLHESGARDFLYGFQPTVPALARWDALLDEARALPPGETLIASSEEFIRLGAHAPAAALLKQVAARAAGVRVRIIAYLRAPNDHLRSWYNQLVKLGLHVPGFDATVLNLLEPVHWDYARALAPWTEAFGADAVTLRTYRPDLREGGALFLDFARAMGLPPPPENTLLEHDPNPRIDDRMLAYVRVLNARGLPADQRDRIHARGVDALIDRDQLLSRADVVQGFDQISARAAQGLRALAGLPGADLDLGTLLASPVTPETDAERDRAEVIALLLGELLTVRAELRQLGRQVQDLKDAQDARNAGKQPGKKPGKKA